MPQTPLTPSAPSPRRGRFVAIQVLLLITCYAAWIGTQHLLEAMRGPSPALTDHVHVLLQGVNAWLNQHVTVANIVLALSSFEVDLAGVSMTLIYFRTGRSRPILTAFFLLIARQLCQASFSIPAPEGMIWRNPGFPSLIVTYTTSTDFFFSGHMGMATMLAAELSAQGKRDWRWWFAWGVLPVQAFIILAMRFHYVTDVVTGFLAALAASALADRVGAVIDARTGSANCRPSAVAGP